FLLRSANLVVKTYDSGAAFLRTLSQIAYGCIITDVRMPGLSGIELLRHLKDSDLKLPVIVITGHGDVPIAVEAMKLGAVDFFEKPFDGDKIIEAVQSALSDWQKDADRETERREVQDRLATLTPREREVLRALVAGNPNKVIAYDLGISPRTVEIYRANVMTKTKARSLSELVRLVLHAGILDQ
ncbi:MAG TPA: response regulator FixJ, partial [Xanthobacteraceae bacterium]|nr:response regulator FixJ [Xanthobacteraceae bacterium]